MQRVPLTWSPPPRGGFSILGEPLGLFISTFTSTSGGMYGPVVFVLPADDVRSNLVPISSGIPDEASLFAGTTILSLTGSVSDAVEAPATSPSYAVTKVS